MSAPTKADLARCAELRELAAAIEQMLDATRAQIHAYRQEHADPLAPTPQITENLARLAGAMSYYAEEPAPLYQEIRSRVSVSSQMLRAMIDKLQHFAELNDEHQAVTGQ